MIATWPMVRTRNLIGDPQDHRHFYVERGLTRDAKVVHSAFRPRWRLRRAVYSASAGFSMQASDTCAVWAARCCSSSWLSRFSHRRIEDICAFVLHHLGGQRNSGDRLHTQHGHPVVRLLRGALRRGHGQVHETHCARMAWTGDLIDTKTRGDSLGNACSTVEDSFRVCIRAGESREAVRC